MSRVRKSRKSVDAKNDAKNSQKNGVKKTNLKRRSGNNVGGKPVVDARLKIIANNRSKVVDARDKLASLAKKTDARQKLQKIRNLKEGKVQMTIFFGKC